MINSHQLLWRTGGDQNQKPVGELLALRVRTKERGRQRMTSSDQIIIGKLEMPAELFRQAAGQRPDIPFYRAQVADRYPQTTAELALRHTGVAPKASDAPACGFNI